MGMTGTSGKGGQTVHLHLSCCPAHPLRTGTGKTETVKELARGVAKQCIVFNTTEQLDVSHMTRLLMGITSTGAWSCFDEFNRMDMEVRWRLRMRMCQFWGILLLSWRLGLCG